MNREKIEKLTGGAVSEQEIAEALPQAMRKLDILISMFGDLNGKRRTEEYFAQLMAEVIGFNRTEKILYELAAKASDPEKCALCGESMDGAFYYIEGIDGGRYCDECVETMPVKKLLRISGIPVFVPREA